MGKFSEMSTQPPASVVAEIPYNIGAAFARKRKSATGDPAYQRSPDRSTQVGDTALASGDLSVAVGPFSLALEDETVAAGAHVNVRGRRSVAVGSASNITKPNSVLVGSNSVITGINGTLVGQGGTLGGKNSTGLGRGVNDKGFHSVILLGAGAEASAANQLVKGSITAPITSEVMVGSANGVSFSIKTLTELLTIAAAATTDTVFVQIPANVIVKAVTVRTTTVIPTAATYTVTGATSGTVFNTAAVSTAANSTDDGTAAGAFFNAAAQNIRITPNLTPAANTGRVRVTVIFEAITPAAS